MPMSPQQSARTQASHLFSEVAAWLLGLFSSAFLSATLLPGNSEAVLLSALHFRPDLGLLAVLVASLGNTLGGLLTVWLGRRLPQAPQTRWVVWAQRIGAPSLLLSWVPLAGDALCGVAGWLRWSWLGVVMYMAVGKTLRYLAIYTLMQ